MTRRVQFPRSSVTGNIPADLQAGTPAFNWADGKMYVGDAGAQAQLFSQRITDHDPTLVYRAGDFVIQADDLWRAVVDIPANVGFRESEWQRLTTSGGADAGLRAESGLIDGGTVTWSGNDNVLNVAAGTGLLVDRTDNAVISVQAISWGAFQITVTGWTNRTFALWINDGGASINNLSRSSLERTAVRLATGIWSIQNSAIDRVWPNSATLSGQTMDAARNYLGRVQLRNGIVVSAGTGLTISRTAGAVGGIAINGTSATRNFSTIDPATFRLVSQSEMFAATTAVPVTQYDLDGVLTPIPAGNATIHIVKAGTDGTVYIEYGQRLYGGVTEAVNGLFEYTALRSGDGGYTPSLTSPFAVPVAAIIVTPEAVDFTDPATSRIVNSTGDLARPFPEADEQDSSNFYLLDGSRPLSGPMNAGGNDIINARLAGDQGVTLVLKNSGTTGFPPAGLEANEIGATKIDRKLYLGTEVVADRIEEHSNTRDYQTGDIVVESAKLYQAPSDISGGEFNPLDWIELGASGGVGEAVILAPEALGRNTIDLTGFPAVDGLKIIGDPSQTESLADLGGAIIDRYGMPRGNFGGQVIRVAQATHGFTAVGQAVAFENPNWTRADPNDATIAGKALGVVHRVVDANNVDIQLGGTVVNLDTAAFEGGVISAGQTYYVSETTAGRLTTSQPTLGLRIDPVLVTTGATEGVLVIGSGTEDSGTTEGKTSFTVNQAGHGFTAVGQPIRHTDTGWVLAQADDIGTAGVGLVEAIADTNNFTVNTGGLIIDLDPAAFAGAVAPTAGTFYYVSQTNAGQFTEIAPTDGQVWNALLLATGATTGVVLASVPHPSYLKTSGGTVSGALTLQSALDVTGPTLLRTSTDITSILEQNPLSVYLDPASTLTNVGIAIRDKDRVRRGAVRFDFDLDRLSLTRADDTGSFDSQVHLYSDDVRLGGVATVPADSASLMTRARGDGRYLQLATGGTVTGDILLEGGAELSVQSPDATTSAIMRFRNESGGIVGNVYYARTNEQMRILSYDPTGSNSRTYEFPNNSQPLGGNSVLRRSEADARYLQVSNAPPYTEGTISVRVSDSSVLNTGNESPTVGSGNFIRTGNLMYVQWSISDIDTTGLTQNTRIYFHMRETSATGQFIWDSPNRAPISVLTDTVSGRSAEVFMFVGVVGNNDQGVTIREIRQAGNNQVLNVENVRTGDNFIQMSGTYWVEE